MRPSYLPVIKSGLTQAGGAQTIELPVAYTAHTITVVPAGSPTAGTLTVEFKPYGSPVFVELATTISMLSPTTYILEVPAIALRVTPSGFDGTSYDVIVVGW